MGSYLISEDENREQNDIAVDKINGDKLKLLIKLQQKLKRKLKK